MALVEEDEKPADWDELGIDAILSTMLEYPSHEAVQELACKVLCLLTNGEREDGQYLFVEQLYNNCALHPVLAAVVAYPSNDEIFQNGGRVIIRLKAFEDKDEPTDLSEID